MNPKTPNLDIWRNIYDEVKRRGGLKADGDQMLKLIWQPSHTRAHKGESHEQRHLRRGNDAADFFANRGRELHGDYTEMITKVKAHYTVAVNLARWLGKASSLQYDKDWNLCDHDVKPKGKHASDRAAKQDVAIPVEAKVIRRLPWARSSLGTIEFLDDLWTQDSTSHHPPDDIVTLVANAAHNPPNVGSSNAERAYVDKFHRVMSTQSSSVKGRRLVPRTGLMEMNQPLPTEAAMGHFMMTSGMGPQYFWCNICCAYTGHRARKLTRQCDRTVRKVPAVEALRNGIHPALGTNLLPLPRRLCKRDVGTHNWSGDGRPDDNLAVCNERETRSADSILEFPSELSLSLLDAEEEPFGFGFDIGQLYLLLPF